MASDGVELGVLISAAAHSSRDGGGRQGRGGEVRQCYCTLFLSDGLKIISRRRYSMLQRQEAISASFNKFG